MQPTVFLITPPFTQLNTPYPATAYLKGFLDSKGINSVQADLGLEVLLALFTASGLQQMFAVASAELSPNARRIYGMQRSYIGTIEAVIGFLQGSNPTLAQRIAHKGYLPEATRFEAIPPLEPYFGTMGLQDKAKYRATLYIEDLADFITEAIDPHFGFTRYAERIARSANSFDELYAALSAPSGYASQLMLSLLQTHIERVQPQLVAISVPFPGNLLAGLQCGKWLKKHYPHIKIAMGGGYPNTELRSLAEPRLFECLDYVTLDDGEAPLEQLINHIAFNAPIETLKRTFICEGNTIKYINNTQCADYKQSQTGVPNYEGLLLNKYIQAMEVINPMHSLWSNGRWNKLTMAHGCYWGKCTFCDISLDYIARYEPLAASAICDKMEALIAQTGTTGFHFVDEAAPPALMRELALEIIKRQMNVTWWTNVRFEKSFTRHLCHLLRLSGCIAVSGGLEVASNRLLRLIDKGITVEQAATVTHNFTDAGILVHAYLMYGFPTQTTQETIDSLEVVRQMFEQGTLHSAYWHRFALTAHSPVGLNPAQFNITITTAKQGTFANNDLDFTDPTGIDHDQFTDALKKATFNYMQGVGVAWQLHKWFDQKVPKTTIAPNYIKQCIDNNALQAPQPDAKVVYTAPLPGIEIVEKSKHGEAKQWAILTFNTTTEVMTIKTTRAQGEWLLEWLKLITTSPKRHTLREAQAHYEASGLTDFELFWDNKPINTLYKAGLYVV